MHFLLEEDVAILIGQDCSAAIDISRLERTPSNSERHVLIWWLLVGV